MRGLAFGLACAVLLCGCYRKDPRYCDQDTPCGPGQVCVLAMAACVPAATGDGMLAGDLGQPRDLARLLDLAGKAPDQGPDASADMKTSCKSISSTSNVLACAGTFASVIAAASLCESGSHLCTTSDDTKLATILAPDCNTIGGFFASAIPVSMRTTTGTFNCSAPSGSFSGGMLIGCGSGAGTKTVNLCHNLSVALECALGDGWDCPNAVGSGFDHNLNVGGVLCCKG